ncbi:MotA/TolQ/ExbB proton channel family protein [uncultured Shewanella sp.]|uniref:MotA/TolQ/ExbB proton channel family protein n=1 Tax=uncultured Shewanella sp. TaxID=173975 RepID=UPI00262A0F1A|nr:MotA/TolQ/ExbB proton channel family protein [uncultured Shewanella sp.]
MIDIFMTFFKDGGVFMYPIAIIGAVGAGVVIERLISLMINSKQITASTDLFERKISKNKGEALKSLVGDKSLLSSTLSEAVKSYQSHSVSKEEFEELTGIKAVHSLRRVTRRTTVISTLANVATLLGLLGTIFGLIQSFASVAQAAAEDKSAMLSASVSIAMNTTAFGLMVAIPLLLVYLFIDNLSNKTLEHLQVGCATVINRLYSAQHNI